MRPAARAGATSGRAGRGWLGEIGEVESLRRAGLRGCVGLRGRLPAAVVNAGRREARHLQEQLVRGRVKPDGRVRLASRAGESGEPLVVAVNDVVVRA
ncbi:MAG TPA: hypothetical protein VHU19_11925 [Pyrinomonadaceae bacterium]|nr:hypothetical protein [Pyrinomonadaceae bacterium]